MSDAFRHWLGTILLGPMALSAMYSANTFDLRDRFPPPATFLQAGAQAGQALQADGQGPAIDDVGGETKNVARSQPWWQHVTEFSGNRRLVTDEFSIGSRSIQWRVSWKCETGSFAVAAQLPSGKKVPRALVPETACPKQDIGYSVQTGRFALAIQATGPWSLKVEQQVDVPLVEPPLPEMSHPDAKVLRTGDVYNVDRVGRGTVKIIELPDGTKAIRLDDFFVSQNSDLELRLSELPEPKTTPEIAAAPFRNLEFLKATTGSMNYLIPGDVDLSRYRSLVIWCELTHNAYAAASLE